MSSFVLSCCSTADLSHQHFVDRNIHYICFHFTMNGKSYSDDLGQSIPFEDFYRAMTEGADTRTSQVNTGEYVAYFEEFLKAGQDVLHLCLSSGISGSYNSACVAAEELRPKYPERKLYVVDSLAASSGYGLLMDKLADLRVEFNTIDEVRYLTEKHKKELNHWFFSSDLTFFVKGGRVSKASGWFGTVLHICPLLNVSYDGKLIPRFKIRGKSKVIREIVAKMEEHAQGGRDYAGKCYICNSACLEDAKAVAQLVEERFPKLNGKVEINSIGTVIGSHTGPGTVALFFWGDERVD